ncbi:MAG: hypothetical protein U1E62_18465 [Alsobacter sp.]
MSDDHTTITPTGLADFDAGRYLPELAEFDISEAQKAELLGTLWSIMRAFVELGFDVKICEQIFTGCGLPAPDSSDALQSAHRIDEEFAAAGGGEEGRG